MGDIVARRPITTHPTLPGTRVTRRPVVLLDGAGLTPNRVAVVVLWQRGPTSAATNRVSFIVRFSIGANVSPQ